MDPKSNFSFLICSSNSQLVVRASNVKNPAFHKKVLAVSICNSHFLYKHIHRGKRELHMWMEVTLIGGGGVPTSPQYCSLFPDFMRFLNVLLSTGNTTVVKESLHHASSIDGYSDLISQIMKIRSTNLPRSNHSFVTIL